MGTSTELLERFRFAHGKDINLDLRPPYRDLLAALGSPEHNLPPTIIIAGTNGKGSTCAFLRAIIEAAGRTAHVYTSPHLISFHERIRIAGRLIEERELVALLQQAEKLAQPGGVSHFEVATAIAFAAFAKHKADMTLLEVGLGGRLDATNVVRDPIACVISRLSFDHRIYLGNSMAEIAHEKAGIMRTGVPCFIAPQPSLEALASLQEQAEKKGVSLCIGGEDWRIETTSKTLFRFVSANRVIENIPRPALIGTHQLWNAGLAIATLSSLPFTVSDAAVYEGMTKVIWPGRLQLLEEGKLVALLPQESELWLDGGHNDSAGEALAAQLGKWRTMDNRPIDLVYAMLTSKKPEEYLPAILPYVRHVRTVRVDGEVKGFDAQDLAAHVQACGGPKTKSCSTIQQALQELVAKSQGPSRILVCGSLYLVGKTLKENGNSVT